MPFELVETRNISGRGILKIAFEKSEYRALKLYIDVIRRPKNIYLNKQWNPDKSFYANLNFCQGGYVQESRALHFDHECINLVPDVAGQTLFALKCALDEIFESFVNLETALGLPVISVYNGIKDFTALRIDWDTILIQCYADTAIQLRLFRLKYEVCKADDDRQEPPPPPPAKPPQVPPGTPLSNNNYPVSPPYTEGDTAPYPDDIPSIPTFPQGGECEKVAIVYRTRVHDTTGDGVTEPSDNGVVVFAPVDNVAIGSDSTKIEVTCRGAISAPGVPSGVDTCQPDAATYEVNATPFGYFVDLEIVSITPTP